MLWLECGLINHNYFDFPHHWSFFLLSLHFMDSLGILIRLRRKVSFFSLYVEVDKPWDWVLEIIYLLRRIIHPPIHLSVSIGNFFPELSIFLPELIIDGFLSCYKVSHNLGKVHNCLFKVRGLLKGLSNYWHGCGSQEKFGWFLQFEL